MKNISLAIIFFFFTISSFAQKEANIWYFGDNAGLDFNSGTPVVLLDGQLSTEEGCATISDSNGNLLFYTDGITVYNKNHQIMMNGNGLKGNPSSTHSAIIVPIPNNIDGYYIFTVDAAAGPKGLQYSEVDMSLDGGLGAVTLSKNILLHTPSTEKITAVKAASEDAFWIISHKFNSDEFLVYKVSASGVNINPVISSLGTFITFPELRSHGAMKVSPNGKKLALAIIEFGFELYDFNNLTGVVSNHVVLSNNQYGAYGVEFSSNSNFLYTSAFNDVSQYSLSAGSANDIINSKTRLSFDDSSLALQLATDGKIYVAKLLEGYLDVINNPNVAGLGSNYQSQAVTLGGRTCKFGLPPFIQSFFNLEDIIFEKTCFGDQTKFSLNDTVDSLVWDFGDPTSGANNISTDFEPIHVFSSPGTYEIRVIATVGGNTAEETGTVTIYELPSAYQPQNILTCDINNDGFYNFDLTKQDMAILNGQDPAIFEVVYFSTITNYTNNTAIVDPTNYVNKTAYISETIIAIVKNKKNNTCVDILNFNIQVFETPKPNQAVSKLVLCDNTSIGTDTDGVIKIDLKQKEAEILDGQDVANFEVKYFTDVAMLNEIITPSQYENLNIIEPIYVQVLNRTKISCPGTTMFSIEVIGLPITISSVELKQCDDDLDGFSAFNLNEVINEITNNSANETITFFESQLDARSNNNPITNPMIYVNQTVSVDDVWARIENSNECFRTSQVNLIVTTTQIPNTFTRDFFVCDDDIDGISQFDFSSIHSEIEAIFPFGQQLIINYYRNETDALAEENLITDISNYRNIGYPNTQQIYVRVDGELDNDCLGLGSHINLYVEPIPVANPVTMDRQCDDDQDEEFLFDVSLVESTILGGQSLTNVTIAYYDENNNPLPSPLPNPFLTASQIVKVKLTNNNVIDGSCFDETTLEFIVDKLPIANPVTNQISCDDGADDSDGLHDFDTSLIEGIILNGQTGMEVHYYNESGLELPSPLPNPFVSGTQTVTVEVINPINTSCTAITDIEFIVNPLPEFTIETPQIVCSSNPTFAVVLDPIETNFSEIFDYEWIYQDGTILSNNPTLTVSTSGTYSITLTKTDGTGCSRTRDIFVNASEFATITQNDITVVDNSNNNSVRINTTSLGQGDYEFSLDYEFSNYQNNPFFENVSSGIHTLYVRDKKGCGTSSIAISVIGLPKFFTPNNDGFNDYWQIQGVEKFPNAEIYIFDRFGKLLKMLKSNDLGWDGTFNGQAMFASDYWFTADLGDGRTFKGHFSLKR